jgi:hypothetical protein
MAALFWNGSRVTEITIARLGTIKTAANIATQYVEDIKNIKADAEHQKKELMATLDTLKTQIDQARAETQKLVQRMADRILQDPQIQEISNKIKQYAGQEIQIVTYFDMKEPLALSNQLYTSLDRAGWKYIKLERATFMLAGIEGVEVWRHPDAEDRVQKGADALVAALNDAHLDAVLKLQNAANPIDNKIMLKVGTKP